MNEIDISALDGRLLRVMCDVYDLGSISKAASKRGLNQSTVSYSVDRLRVILGDQLFRKNGRNIEATEFTHNIMPSVRRIIDDLEGLVADRTYDPASDTVDLRIYLNANELLPEMWSIYNEVRLRGFRGHVRFLELGSRSNIEGLLQSGDADFVVSVRPSPPVAIAQSITLSSDPVVCYFDPEVRTPIHSIEEYSAAEHIVLDFGGDKASTVGRSLQSEQIDRNIRLSVPSVVAMSTMIKGSPLIASMQERLSRSIFADLAYCPTPFACPRIHFDLIWHRRNENSTRNKWFRSIIPRLTVFQE